MLRTAILHIRNAVPPGLTEMAKVRCGCVEREGDRPWCTGSGSGTVSGSFVLPPYLSSDWMHLRVTRAFVSLSSPLFICFDDCGRFYLSPLSLFTPYVMLWTFSLSFASWITWNLVFSCFSLSEIRYVFVLSFYTHNYLFVSNFIVLGR